MMKTQENKTATREFCFKSIKELENRINSEGYKIRLSDNLQLLAKPVDIGGHKVPNSLALHPMEGCDGNTDGSPGELTWRRYMRFAGGGAGLIWFEATAVVPEGRANSRQLWINENNLPEFGRLYEGIVKSTRKECGGKSGPLCIMQLTHSGRYSRPHGKPEPIIACHNPYLEKGQNTDIMRIISDCEIEELEERFEEAAVLAYRAGFHGVDIKCCHRYLNSELLSAFTREGRYGGTFEGRTEFLLNVTGRIQARMGKFFIVTTRINIYDGIPYPYGWGADRDNYEISDQAEPVKLAKLLYKRGMRIINVTMGNPYYNPHINRPYDRGWYTSPEHPLKGVERLINGAAEIQKAVPGMVVVGTGYSWLRHLSQHAAAGAIENGLAGMIGYGREAFAYPDFARDIVFSGGMKKEKCCIACGKCTDIMRAGGTPGCVIRDAAVYAPVYNKLLSEIK